MTHIEQSPFNAIHFYRTEHSQVPVPYCNFMETPDLYWQPLPATNYLPICFATKASSSFTVSIKNQYGQELVAKSMYSQVHLDTLFYYIDYIGDITLMNSLAGQKVIIEIISTPNPSYYGFPVYRGFVEFKSFDWMIENCVLLTTQLNKVTMNALHVNYNNNPITYYSWFRGAIKHSEMTIEDNYNTFRDQAWRESLVSRRFMPAYPIRIGDSRGVPSWVLETLNAFCSTEWLHLNDTIRVSLSSKSGIASTVQGNINRVNISLDLIERDTGLRNGSETYEQINGMTRTRYQYDFYIPTDSIGRVNQSLNRETVIPIGDKMLYDATKHYYRGTMLEYRTNNLGYTYIVKSSRVESVFYKTSSDDQVETRLMHVYLQDIYGVHVTHKLIPNSNNTYRLADYDTYLDETLKHLFNLNPVGNALPAGTFQFIGSSLLYNPTLNTIRFTGVKAGLYAIFKNDTEAPISYPVRDRSVLYLRSLNEGLVYNVQVQVSYISKATGDYESYSLLKDIQGQVLFRGLATPDYITNNSRLYYTLGMGSIRRGIELIIAIGSSVLPPNQTTILVTDPQSGYALLSDDNYIIMASSSQGEASVIGGATVPLGPVSMPLVPDE